MGCPAAWAGGPAAQAPPRGVNPAWPEGEAPALLMVVGRGMLWGEWNLPGAQGASPDASSTGTSAQLGVRGDGRHSAEALPGPEVAEEVGTQRMGWRWGADPLWGQRGEWRWDPGGRV